MIYRLGGIIIVKGYIKSYDFVNYVMMMIQACIMCIFLCEYFMISRCFVKFPYAEFFTNIFALIPQYPVERFVVEAFAYKVFD